jgi:chromosome condensin MukBEF ATPase and DNA-binding subunit MukB
LLDTQTGQQFIYTDDGVNQEWEPIQRKKSVAEGNTEVRDNTGKVVSWKNDTEWHKAEKNKKGQEKDPRGVVTHLSDVARRKTEKQDTKEGKIDFAKKLGKNIDKSNKAVVKTNKEIGSRVADIGAGGKEYNVKTDKEWDKQKSLEEGQDSNEIGPGWKTEHGIVDRVEGNSVIVKTSKGKMRVNMHDIKTAEAPEQGVTEMNVGKRKPKPDSYHINKDGKPVSLASYDDKDSAIKDRDEKHPGAEVHQVGSRGKVKGKFEEAKDPCWDNYKQIGMKKKNGKTVPNCVPKK